MVLSPSFLAMVYALSPEFDSYVLSFRIVRFFSLFSYSSSSANESRSSGGSHATDSGGALGIAELFVLLVVSSSFSASGLLSSLLLFKSDDALAAVFLSIQFCLLPPLKAL